VRKRRRRASDVGYERVAARACRRRKPLRQIYNGRYVDQGLVRAAFAQIVWGDPYFPGALKEHHLVHEPSPHSLDTMRA
jgi:hypothetical protein